MKTVSGRIFLPSVAPPRSFPAEYGLFSVVSTPTPSDEHWVNGIEWEHPACTAVSGISGSCDDVAEISKVFLPDPNTIAGADAFTVYGSYTCSPTGNEIARAEQYARENLQRHEQEGVEDAIWSGSLNTTPVLATATTTDLTPTPGTAIPAKQAVGLLASHAAATFGVASPVIHAPRIASGVLTADGIAIRVGDHFELATGELVAFEAGSPNTGPAGSEAPAGEAWLYVTPPVTLVRTDIFVSPPTPKAGQGLDRNTNDLLSVAERIYAVGWDDCPLAAVLVDLTAV